MYIFLLQFISRRPRRKGSLELENSPKLNCAHAHVIKKKNLDTHAHALVVSSSNHRLKRERERESSARFVPCDASFEDHTRARFFESGVEFSFSRKKTLQSESDQKWKTKTARSSNKKKTRSIRTASSSTRHRRRRQEVNRRDTRRRRTNPIARRDVEVVVVSSKW